MANQNQPNPNEQPKQPKNPERKFPRAEDPELNPIDYADQPPPVVKANAEGEGDDEQQAANTNEENEGEGNKTADRNYRKGVKKTLDTRNIEQDARKAAEALDDEREKKDLDDAEEAARKGQVH